MKTKVWTGMLLSVFFVSCAMGPKLAKPDQLTAPSPIMGNSGKYMSPFTEDGTLTEWVDMAIKAKAGAEIGSAAGAYAGQKVMEQIPFVGGMLGSAVGERIGREIAIKNAGGLEHIRETSDISFNSLDDMAVYLYVKYSTKPHYKDALDATFQIYPDFKKRYQIALINASREMTQ